MGLDEILTKRGFIFISSEIYGGVAGFYDYGHLGTLVKHKFENLWRNYFLKLDSNFYEIDASLIMPEKVFVASGHLKNFIDPITTCKKCKADFRADHLVEEKIKESAEHMNNEELTEKIKELKLKCLKCGNELGPVSSLNLMFDLTVGSNEKGYLRPETAQGCYVSFKRLFDATRKKLPLGLAIIGKAFRNEISPRQKIYRMREFTQSELQIFFDPDRINECEKFDEISEEKVRIKFAGDKEIREVNCKALLDKIPKFIVYYMAKVQQFYLNVLGISPEKLRFRELDENEKAFYNKYHFDVELYSESFKNFKEIGGIHYRTDHDLLGHQEVSGENLEVGIEERKFIPHVLELSFGVDRTIYFLFEFSFSDKMMKLNPLIAPFALGIFPLVNKDGLDAKAEEVHFSLRDKFDCFFDSGGSIGRRYARADEIGIPYGITIDYETREDNSVTLRDRDSTEQIRVNLGNLEEVVGKLLKREISFKEIGDLVNTRKKEEGYRI